MTSSSKHKVAILLLLVFLLAGAGAGARAWFARRASQPGSSPDAPIQLKFDVIGGWKFIEGKTPIPDQVQQLNGKWVELRGFMLPINEIKKIRSFVVIQSLWGCCFGQTPEVNHVIVVTMEPGKTVEFYPDPIRVIGQFAVGETREDGYLVSIYRLEGHKVLAD